MKKILISLLVLGLLISTTVVNAAEVETKGIAVVDVQKVVAESSEVKKLEKERIKQEKELQVFLTNAKKTIDEETDKNKKIELQEKYNKDITAKINSQKVEVLKKTKTIENNILKAVKDKAVELGYNMVIVKGSVLYGGDDITEQVIKSIK